MVQVQGAIFALARLGSAQRLYRGGIAQQFHCFDERALVSHGQGHINRLVPARDDEPFAGAAELGQLRLRLRYGIRILHQTYMYHGRLPHVNREGNTGPASGASQIFRSAEFIPLPLPKVNAEAE